MIKPLGARSKEILQAIADYIDMHGLPPSFRDIAERTGLSSMSSVHYHIQTLRDRGLIIDHSASRRSLVPTRKGYRAIGRDQDPPEYLAQGMEEEPRVGVIPRHVGDALTWLYNDVVTAQQRGRAIPGYCERIAQWWDKIRRDHGDR